MQRSKNAESKLSTLQVIGNSGKCKTLLRSEQGSLILICSHNIVSLNPETKQQQILSGSMESKNVSAICMNERKDILLIAETGKLDCFLSVYEVSLIRLRLLPEKKRSKLETRLT